MLCFCLKILELVTDRGKTSAYIVRCLVIILKKNILNFDIVCQMSISIFSVHFPLRVESSTQWSNPQNDFQHHSLLVVVAISVVVVVVVLFAVAALLYFVFFYF